MANDKQGRELTEMNMANEGSTKPTYSELEAENLRVRGLLQRQWISVEERLPELDKMRDRLNKEFGLAGSAETGGEKAAPLSDSQMQMWIAVEMFEDDWDEPRPLWEDLPEADRNSYIKMAGAAIRVFGVSTFPRSSQNQTVSSGVEGAHEGNTADKCKACLGHGEISIQAGDAEWGEKCSHCNGTGKSGSREPEKLNNARPEEFCKNCGSPEAAHGDFWGAKVCAPETLSILNWRSPP
jgi:hypothetical protein